MHLALRRQGYPVFVHWVRTLVGKLGACQVVIVRPSTDTRMKQTRNFVRSELEADTETILADLAIRRGIETFSDDLKDSVWPRYW